MPSTGARGPSGTGGSLVGVLPPGTSGLRERLMGSEDMQQEVRSQWVARICCGSEWDVPVVGRMQKRGKRC